MQERDNNLTRYEESLIHPKKPDFNQQLAIWAFTHPAKDEFAVIIGRPYTPNEIAESANKGDDTLIQDLCEYVAEVGRENNILPETYIQRAIEANLRTELPEGKKFRSKINEVNLKYSYKLAQIPGVMSVASGKMDIRDYSSEDCLLIVVDKPDTASKLPYELEGIRTVFIAGGTITH